jgi:hypothetical protein
MSRFKVLSMAGAGAAGLFLVAALPIAAVHAQGTAKESIPGGVEAKPSDSTATAPKSMPTPAPVVGAPAIRSMSPQLETTPPKPLAPKKVPIAKSKSPKKSKVEPLPLTRSFAPGTAPSVGAVPPSPAPPAPSKNGKESMPGAVERSPGQPAPAPQ